jgi:hypothetical protein
MPQQRRWQCWHCKTGGWSADGAMPPHDKRAGGPCRASGQRTEREIREALASEIRMGGRFTVGGAFE